MAHRHRLGALPDADGATFRLWSPEAASIQVVFDDETVLALDRVGDGYFEGRASGVRPGDRYRLRKDDGPLFPDPASRFQPEGVHGPSEIVDPAGYAWQDDGWTPPAQSDLVFYELHVGTFTPQGTFRGVIDRLPYLRDLGITALNVMPVADFPGDRNWGYDPASLYAPSRAYGRPDELRALVDAAHGHGLAVVLDVVYNHLGPDGAYLAAFAPMFTDRHHTPWGAAINLDDTHSHGVRNLILDNALHWLEEYRLDGFRLDATHALLDDSPTHLLQELAQATREVDGRRRYLIAEDHRNLNTLLIAPKDGGYGLDAVWTDDFHHLVRNHTAGDAESYYAHFAGATAADLAETLERGWFYDGRPSPVTGEPRGTSPEAVRPDQCVVCIQNHDQVGNRPTGTRLHHQIDAATYRAASALLLCAPELPLLFMGQEWATSAPFQFFTDHNDELGRQVTAGRKAEFKDFAGFEGEVPDPQDADTFARSRLPWDELDEPGHCEVYALYRALLAARRHLDGPAEVTVHSDAALTLRRGDHHLLVTLSGDETLPWPEGAASVLHTEKAPYVQASRPAERRGDAVYFHRPGAWLCRVG